MKSVGEVMAIGRTWQESLQKALRGMEAGLDGWSLPKGWKHLPRDQLTYKLRVPNPDRMIIMKQVRHALAAARIAARADACCGVHCCRQLRSTWMGTHTRPCCHLTCVCMAPMQTLQLSQPSTRH